MAGSFLAGMAQCDAVVERDKINSRLLEGLFGPFMMRPLGPSNVFIVLDRSSILLLVFLALLGGLLSVERYASPRVTRSRRIGAVSCSKCGRGRPQDFAGGLGLEGLGFRARFSR
jgi:hypothetical protein